MPRRLIATGIVVMIWFPSGVQALPELASDASQSTLSFSAFGTAGAVHSSESRADFTSSVFKPNGAGFSHSWSTDVDSILGAQVVGNFTSQLSTTIQVISQQRYDNTYTPVVQWANIKYEFTPDISLRVGRIVLPSFLLSDSRNVGFANVAVRPPVEVYSLVPVTNNDGVDASYRFHIGEITQTLLGSYGRTENKEPRGGDSQGRRQWVICDTLEYGAATLHVAYQEAHLTIEPLDGFIDAFRSFGPQGIALANRYGQNDKRLQFVGLGGTYNPGEWFLTGEWGATDLHSVLGKSTGWYVSTGYRFGTFTPFINYATIVAMGNKSDPGLNVGSLPTNLVGPAIGLNAGLNAILGSAPTQNTATFGVRWDFARNVDLKAQYGRSRMGAGSPGTFFNLQPGFQPGATVNIVSVAVDFVL